jgi:hypothetical protein
MTPIGEPVLGVSRLIASIGTGLRFGDGVCGGP